MIDEKLMEILWDFDKPLTSSFKKNSVDKAIIRLKALVIESLGEIKDCNNCKYISTTEELQDYQAVKSPHICKLLEHRIYHAGRHPLLKPLRNCPLNQHIAEMKEKFK